MVCFEERVLDVRAHAARPLEPVDGGHERVLALCRSEPCPAARGSRRARRRTAASGTVVAARRSRRTAPARSPSAASTMRERVESGCIPGPVPERGAVRLRGRGVVADREEQLAELRLRPGGRLRAGNRALRRELHGGARAGHVPAQLSRVRDARVRGDVRLQPRHRVEGSERLAVATELEERVADRAEVPRRRRRERARLLREGEGEDELMARERERREPGERDRIVAVRVRARSRTASDFG